MKPKALFFLAFSIFLPVYCYGSTVGIDFAVSFNQIYNFSNSQWTNIFDNPINTTAIVIFDIDDYHGDGSYYWGDELQAVSTIYGDPVITSPFISNLSKNPTGVAPSYNGFTQLSNVDYSVSWPETPLGGGAQIAYQFNDSASAVNNGLYWDYIVGFNLSVFSNKIFTDEILQRTPNEFLGYINYAMDNNYLFTTGFNSRVLDAATYQNLYGYSYQGTARIVGVNNLTPVPEPSTFVLLGAGLSGIATVTYRRRKKS